MGEKVYVAPFAELDATNAPISIARRAHRRRLLLHQAQTENKLLAVRGTFYLRHYPDFFAAQPLS
ncbi:MULTISPECIES: hypothetical protein [Fischerella]|uniref:hypothetical protein n=1 Tax=Fischerella TaxID=1190 RepID=UPI0002F629E2|nr:MULTISPECIES: hypothetical protein [Fischerella]MBD2431576.1 hypothetical protein [Fischerella sp. FACHB-380]